MNTPIRSFLRWLLGPLPKVERTDTTGSLTALLFGVAFIAMWLDTKHGIRKPPGSENTWTFAVYGVFPLGVLVACLAPARSGARWVAAAATVALCAVLGSRLVAPATWGKALEDSPERFFGTVALLGAVVVAAGFAGGVAFKDWGLGFGDWRWWLPRFALVAVLMELMVIWAAWYDPEIRKYYPELKAARTDFGELLRYQAWLGVYMFGWEAFFRGTFLNGMARRGDIVMALFVPALPFFLLHWHKPEMEMLSSFIGSVGAGWFCLNARSFWPVFLMHWAMNFSMEATCFVWRQVEASS